MYWLDKFVTKIFKYFEWKQVIFIFDKDYQEQITNFNCYLTMASLKAALLNSKINVDYKIRDKQDSRPVETILIDYVGNKFSVILLCGSNDFINELLIAANKIGFNNGEYVFINFDLYALMHSEDRLLKPWNTINNKTFHFINMTEINRPFENLLTVTLKNYDSFENYRKFQQKLVDFSKNLIKNESDVSSRK
jgi:hypothetical protein